MTLDGILNPPSDFLPMTVIYRKITKDDDMINFQGDVDRLGEWAVVNAMKINPSKSKAACFTRARVKDDLNYSLMDTLIPELNKKLLKENAKIAQADKGKTIVIIKSEYYAKKYTNSLQLTTSKH